MSGVVGDLVQYSDTTWEIIHTIASHSNTYAFIGVGLENKDSYLFGIRDDDEDIVVGGWYLSEEDVVSLGTGIIKTVKKEDQVTIEGTIEELREKKDAIEHQIIQRELKNDQ